MASIQTAPMWLIGFAYVAAYVVLDWLSLVASSASLGIVPWSPETGLSFAAFLFCGRRFWPYLLVAVAASNVILRGAALPMVSQLLTPLFVGGG